MQCANLSKLSPNMQGLAESEPLLSINKNSYHPSPSFKFEKEAGVVQIFNKSQRVPLVKTNLYRVRVSAGCH